MKKFFSFFTESNRWKHFLAGAAIGVLTLNPWDALVASGAAGAACEYKDMRNRGYFDPIDLACTIAGGLCGYGIQQLCVWIWT